MLDGQAVMLENSWVLNGEKAAVLSDNTSDVKTFVWTKFQVIDTYGKSANAFADNQTHRLFRYGNKQSVSKCDNQMNRWDGSYGDNSGLIDLDGFGDGRVVAVVANQMSDIVGQVVEELGAS
jgi:hypothetical protein